MTILTVINVKEQENPFVRTLIEGVSSLGIDMICSIDDFWDNWNKYDVFHFHWPNAVLQISGTKEKKRHSINELIEQISDIKAHNKKIVVTCHNFKPHYSKDEDVIKTYDIIYDAADVFVHLGDYSCSVFASKYPNAKNVVIPHHVYDTLDTTMPTREDAIHKLKLSADKHYIICFGEFRAEEERQLAKLVNDRFYYEGYQIIAPAFFRIPKHRNFLYRLMLMAKYTCLKWKYRKILYGDSFVLDENIPYYYAASDIALIHRKKILNSGNISMAMLMGKIVVGPEVGNVASILKSIKNPVFKTDDNNSIIKAVMEGIILASNGGGERNKEYAIENLSTLVIASKYADLYHSIINSSLIS